MKRFARFLLWVMGWKIKSILPSDIKKCVIIAAPHTSNFDFLIGRLAYFSTGLKISFMIKREAFKHFMGPMLKAAGGIPVDRQKNTDLVNRMVELFHQNESFYIMITPEGTRKLNPNWRRGFYHIAHQAKVPIALAYIDYKKKEGGYGPMIEPSGDFEKDFKVIEDFYRTVTARYPEQFNLTPKKSTAQQTEKSVQELKGQYCCKR